MHPNLERNLPVLSSSVTRLMAISSEDPNYYDLVLECVRTDPGLAAELFKIGRSTLFSGLTEETDLAKCLTRIGGQRFASLVLGSSIRASLVQDHAVFVQLWKHSLWTGSIARTIAAQSKRLKVSADGALGLGMLHNIGAFALARADAEAYLEMFARHAGEPLVLLEAERKHYGTTHADFGALMADRWCLPASAKGIVTQHHSPHAIEKASPADPLILLYLATSVGDLLVSTADQAPLLLERIQEALRAFERRTVPEWDLPRVLRIARDCKSEVEAYSRCLAA